MERDQRFESPDAVQYYAKRGKMLQIALFGLLFMAAGMFLIAIGFGQGEDHSVFTGIIGILSLLLGVAGLGIGLRRLLSLAPALILDKKGLTDRTAAFGTGFVAWTDIRRIEPYTLRGQTFIGIELYEPEAFVRRQSALHRILTKANQGIVSFTVNIGLQGFGSEAETVFRKTEEYWLRFGEFDR